MRLVVTLALTAVVAAQQPARPNVVLCMADDQGQGDVAYNGHPDLQTPVLDEMARSGLRLDRFYAAAPVCSPTRGSVLTGRHPNRFGCFTWGYPIRPQERTIAETLRDAGYTTGHFGKWHLGSVRAGEPTSPGENGFDEWVSSPNFYENSPLMSHRGEVVETEGESSRVTVDAALEFIRAAAENDEPFLAVIWFGNPHTPHRALPEVRRPYADQPERRAHYLGEVTGIDRAMGRLRAGLRELEIAGDTLLWYTSDNGARPPGSNGELRGQKATLWEGGIRVPAIVEWPARIDQPRASSVPAATVDILPTVLAACGVEPDGPEPLDGISLLPLIEGRMAERPRPLGFWVHPARGRPVRSTEILERIRRGKAAAEAPPPVPIDAGLPGRAAWVDGDFKLHAIPDGDGVRYELYDLASDPRERKDLAASAPDRVARMSTELLDWQRSVVRSCRATTK